MAKKKTRKRSKVKTIKEKEFTPIDLIPADYNPRVMDEKSSAALKQSMEEFNDISGITWNKGTKNIVTGHHRWQHLLDAYGIENVAFEQISDDKYTIVAENEDTGFILRVVDWDEAKEKAANITANSHKVEGTFTEDLQNVLDEIKIGVDEELFGNLRLDELDIFKEERDHDNMDWESDLPSETITSDPNLEDLNRDLGVKITVTCLFQDKQKILDLVANAVKGQENVKVG